MKVRGARSSTRLGRVTKPFWLVILVASALSVPAAAVGGPPSARLSTLGDAMAVAQASATGGFHVKNHNLNQQGAPYSPGIEIHPGETPDGTGRCLEQYNIILGRDIVDAAYASLFDLSPHQFLDAASISFDLDGQPLPVQRTANKWNSTSAFWFFTVYWILAPGSSSPGVHTVTTHFDEPGFSIVDSQTFTMGGFGSGFCPGD